MGSAATAAARLILRGVLGFSTAEAGGVPGDGTAAVNLKLRDPADMNTYSDLGKRWVRLVDVLATCRYPARHNAVR